MANSRREGLYAARLDWGNVTIMATKTRKTKGAKRAGKATRNASRKATTAKRGKKSARRTAPKPTRQAVPKHVSKPQTLGLTTVAPVKGNEPPQLKQAAG